MLEKLSEKKTADGQRRKFRAILNACVNLIGAVTTISLATLFGLKGQPTEMGISIAGCAVAMFFVNLNQFESFRVGAIGAELRKAVDEANATIKQLRLVALSSVETALTSLMSSSFIGGTNMETKIRLRNQLINSLREIGIQENEINQSCEMWDRGVGIFFFEV